MNQIKKWIQFIIGLIIVSIGIVLTIKADLGAAPWDVFHISLTKHINMLTVGKASQLTGLAVILFSFFIARIKPTSGTIINMLLVGFMIDLIMSIIPQPITIIYQYIYLIGGIAIVGFGVAVYITAHCGTGPRDSLMMALTKKFNIDIQWIRSSLELGALIIGYLLGGPVGIGTICIALGIGPMLSISLDLLGSLSNKHSLAQTDC
ncbi:YczE/YyaS/YitT family protein [Selenihalanaerobacter shriftii]|uniref:Uncharacterized membrane protein YczE n=1 Tax=Selenihalanaerobacter shriftii TaxID=142842 RepID=A0A1T4N112_9FIRM|nr:membrane protein [Selenihalanaerobacter shriftii]SJZ72794.1 Uncharacterized membrane protein YczE [Selenihalanaerobacter shriftii]